MKGSYYSILLGRAINVVGKKFDGVFDKGGMPYALHCQDVMFQTEYQLRNLFLNYKILLTEEGLPTEDIPIYEKLTSSDKVILEAMIIAVLHDVLEDTNVTHEYLVNHFSKRIADKVQALTRKHASYDDYVNFIIAQNDPLLLIIKMSDIEHNLNEDRINMTGFVNTKKEVYENAYVKLGNELSKYDIIPKILSIYQ